MNEDYKYDWEEEEYDYNGTPYYCGNDCPMGLSPSDCMVCGVNDD